MIWDKSHGEKLVKIMYTMDHARAEPNQANKYKESQQLCLLFSILFLCLSLCYVYLSSLEKD